VEHNATGPGRAPSWKQGLGDGLSQAFALVATPALFVALGLFADDRLGTAPIAAVVLGVLAVVGTAASTYYRYVADMERAQAGKPWTRERA
jgi:hypothetical protein